MHYRFKRKTFNVDFYLILEGSRASTGLCVDVSDETYAVIIQFAVSVRISRENNIIHIYLQGGSTKLSTKRWPLGVVT